MPSCALCENVQPVGEACDVCGHPFPSGRRTDPPVEALLDMEPTLLPRAEAAGERVEGMEATAIGPVNVVSVAVEGLEPTLAEGIPEDGASLEPIFATCRYCHTPSSPGEAFCGQCGMRLPALSGPPLAALAVVLCRDCGTPVRGESCPGCGLRASR